MNALTRRIWERVRQGGFLSVKDLTDKFQLPREVVQEAIGNLIVAGKVELVSTRNPAHPLYSYK